LALEYAEKAFFDDEMVSILYFPDEHKHGIYTPLFGPLALPLVMALLKELRGIFKRWKAMGLKIETGADALIAKEGGDGKSLVMATTTEPVTE
jgi:Phosphatidylinositol-glycan biosynthesis class S protein